MSGRAVEGGAGEHMVNSPRNSAESLSSTESEPLGAPPVLL